jgi:hypothetical protein
MLTFAMGCDLSYNNSTSSSTGNVSSSCRSSIRQQHQ